ncbi:hypothetical protein ACRAWF_39640 [Streptomyces sp. L7]
MRADFRTTLRFWSDRGVDGFRVDVAPRAGRRTSASRCGTSARSRRTPRGRPRRPASPGWPPLLRPRRGPRDLPRLAPQCLRHLHAARMAVAEAWVPAARRALRPPRRTRPGLQLRVPGGTVGTPDELREVITGSLAAARAAGASATWVLSNHDVVRHASRLMLPTGTDPFPPGCFVRRPYATRRLRRPVCAAPAPRPC